MSWQGCRNILCIRPDNMGDLIMTAPAIRALKESFGAKITILTSSMAQGIVKHIPEIDDAIIFDLPWVKTAETPDAGSFNDVVAIIKEKKFDAAVIFTVYSQNPLPTSLIAYLASIPRILAYCRENPYHLITHWVPDKEPYQFIKHQVTRDLDLVASVGATTENDNLNITFDASLWKGISEKLMREGIDVNQPWLILHAGVSEKKREYPIANWVKVAKSLICDKGYQVLLTGSLNEKPLTDELAVQIGFGSHSIAGLFALDEFICLVKHAPIMVSVNTGTTHIAAAVGTKVVVLYAQTNPQHTPWKVPHKVIEFPLENDMRSKNEVIAYVNNKVYNKVTKMPAAETVVGAVSELLDLPKVAGLPFPETPRQNSATITS